MFDLSLATLTSLKMQIVHVGSDFLSTLPGLWERCVQGHVVFVFCVTNSNWHKIVFDFLGPALGAEWYKTLVQIQVAINPMEYGNAYTLLLWGWYKYVLLSV